MSSGSTKLLEAEAAVWTPEYVHASVPLGGLMAGQNSPRLVESLGHPLTILLVRTSVYAWHRRTDGGTPRVWGYYHDTVVRLPEGWRIAQRQLRTLGTEDWPMEMHSALDGELGREAG
jgi:hypothetical protein